MEVQVSGVVAVGFAEGTQHVNWKLLGSILLWWISGFGLVLLVTCALVAQGNLHRCASVHKRKKDQHFWHHTGSSQLAQAFLCTYCQQLPVRAQALHFLLLVLW